MKIQLSLHIADEQSVFCEFNGETTLGRDPDCDFVLSDTKENSWVSGTHARLEFADDGVFLEDLESSNGTFLNNRQLSRRTQLNEGDVFTFGRLGPSFTVEAIVAPVSVAATAAEPVEPNAPTQTTAKPSWLVPALLSIGGISLGAGLVFFFVAGHGDENGEAKNVVGTDNKDNPGREQKKTPGTNDRRTGDPVVATPPAPDDIALQAYEVLKTYCYQCHGVEFKSGDLNVLKRDALIDEFMVVPEDLELSELWQRAGVAKNMPPEKNPKPSDEDLAILKQWIEAGAPEFPVDSPREFLTITDTLTAIRNDLLAASETDRRFYRYYTLTNLHNNSFPSRIGENSKNLDNSELRLARAALSKLINSLSWEAQIVIPKAVDDAETVFRIDIRDVGWLKTDAWKELIARYPYALLHDEDPDEELRNLAREVYRLAGTNLPALRADWFLANAARPPLYEAILELPPQVKPLEEALNVNVEQDFLTNRLRRAGFSESGVSVSNRLVDRHPARYGAYWKSYDFAKSEGRGNLTGFPLGPVFARNIHNQFAFEHDGGEMIFHLPNGLQGYYLSDAAGNFIPKGPIKVVQDASSTSGNAEVVNGLSCMNCHQHGMIRFTDTIRNSRGVTGAARVKVQELYARQSEMDRLLDDDERRFLTALEQAVGLFLQVGPDSSLGIKDFKKEPIGYLARLHHSDLQIEEVAAELGLDDPAKLQTLIENTRQLNRLGLGPLVQGRAIKRTAWEAPPPGETFSTFQLVARELDLGTPARFRPLYRIPSPPE